MEASLDSLNASLHNKDVQAARQQLEEWFGAEELSPALQPYIDHSPNGWRLLRHPLVYCTPYSEVQNRLLNRQLTAKLERLKIARKERDWSTYVFLHERPYRARALTVVMKQIPDSQYWPLLAQVWTDTENLWQWGSLLRKLLLADKPQRRLLMNKIERKLLGELDEVAPLIFRGFTPPGRAKGWSWTFDRKKAEWFAHRFAFEKLPRLAIAEVESKNILAYFDRRGESEVVVDPHHVRVFEVEILRSRK